MILLRACTITRETHVIASGAGCSQIWVQGETIMISQARGSEIAFPLFALERQQTLCVYRTIKVIPNFFIPHCARFSRYVDMQEQGERENRGEQSYHPSDGKMRTAHRANH